MRWCAAAAAAAVALLAGCGVRDDGDFQQIGSDDLAGLDQTTTSSTTTTTTTTIPVAPATIPVSTTAAATSTTIETEPVELYFVAGSLLESVTQPLTRGPSPRRVLTALESGPPSGDAGIGLQSILPIGLTREVRESGTGVAIVDLASDEFETIEGAVDQRRAIAQIVLTLTKRPGIGQVSFTLDDEPLAVPKRGNVLSEPGEPVARIDYESLLSFPDPTTGEPPDSSTTTSLPAESGAGGPVTTA